MIYTDCTVTIKGEIATINTPIVLYRGDKEVEIKFTIMQNPFYQTIGAKTTNVINETDAKFGQLIIKIPNGNPVIGEVTAVEDGYVIFTITETMIDEVEEVGDYDFQIRLFDENKTSRATLPSVVSGIKIKEPLSVDDGTEEITNSNEADIAVANYAITTYAEASDVFDENDKYIETTWENKDLITTAKLNKIEQGITGANDRAIDALNSIPTATSELENDSGFVTTTEMTEAINNVSVDLTGYATEDYVDEAITNASLGGGEVDLSGYAKITDIPTNVSQLTNDAGYITAVPEEYVTDEELAAKGYLTEHQSLEGYAKTTDIPVVPTNVSAFANDANYASETFVTNKIAEAALGGGEVDLSGYVTKETGNASQITFSDGETFQSKLDAGTLKGDKGDTGDPGQDGLTTAISVNGETYTQVDGVITLSDYPTDYTDEINNIQKSMAIDLAIENNILYLVTSTGIKLGTGIELQQSSNSDIVLGSIVDTVEE